MESRTIKVGTQYRAAQLEGGSFNKEKRTVAVKFSTETPVRRCFGDEILDHKESSVRLGRMKAGAAVLCEHDTNQRVGITESATINGNSGEAVVRFARTPAGDQCMAEVEDGTLRWLSVGYVVNKYEVDEDEKEWRAVDWEPLEISFVAIPADNNARVLRANQAQDAHEAVIMKRNTPLFDALPAGGGGGAPAIITKEDFSKEIDEAREILALGAQYQRTHPEVSELCEKAIKDKTGIVSFQRKIMEIVSAPSKERREVLPTETRGDRSVGGRMVASESYKAALKRGKIGRGNHINIELPEVFSFRHDPALLTRATFGIGTSDISGNTDIGGTGGIGIDVRPQFNLLGTQPIAVADLFTQGATGGDQVRIVRELSFTNSAARVAEAGNKPEGQLDFGVVNFPVEKTAVFLNVTEEMLNDNAQAASYVNGRLSYMVQAAEDNYLINGTGSSQITGILNTSGIQTVNGAANTVDQLKRAKSLIEGANGAAFATPTAYLMNPLDWLNVSLTKDGNGQYLFGGPGYAPYGAGGYSNMGMMWGLPVVTTTFLAQGTALVGAFRQGAQIFRRAGVTLRSTDSHASNFIANITTILAESRFAFPVYQPNLFCTITNIPA